MRCRVRGIPSPPEAGTRVRWPPGRRGGEGGAGSDREFGEQPVQGVLAVRWDRCAAQRSACSCSRPWRAGQTPPPGARRMVPHITSPEEPRLTTLIRPSHDRMASSISMTCTCFPVTTAPCSSWMSTPRSPARTCEPGFHPEARYEFKVHFGGEELETLTYRVSFGEAGHRGRQALRLTSSPAMKRGRTRRPERSGPGGPDGGGSQPGRHADLGRRIGDPFYVDLDELSAVNAAIAKGSEWTFGSWRA